MNSRLIPWLSLPLLALAIVALVAYCSDARAEERFTPLPPLVMLADDPDFACRFLRIHEGPQHADGCADWLGRIIAGRCLIILPRNYDVRLAFHEERHCKEGNWHS